MCALRSAPGRRRAGSASCEFPAESSGDHLSPPSGARTGSRRRATRATSSGRSNRAGRSIRPEAEMSAWTPWIRMLPARPPWADQREYCRPYGRGDPDPGDHHRLPGSRLATTQPRSRVLSDGPLGSDVAGEPGTRGAPDLLANTPADVAPKSGEGVSHRPNGGARRLLAPRRVLEGANRSSARVQARRRTEGAMAPRQGLPRLARQQFIRGAGLGALQALEDAAAAGLEEQGASGAAETARWKCADVTERHASPPSMNGSARGSGGGSRSRGA